MRALLGTASRYCGAVVLESGAVPFGTALGWTPLPLNPKFQTVNAEPASLFQSSMWKQRISLGSFHPKPETSKPNTSFKVPCGSKEYRMEPFIPNLKPQTINADTSIRAPCGSKEYRWEAFILNPKPHTFTPVSGFDVEARNFAGRREIRGRLRVSAHDSLPGLSHRSIRAVNPYALVRPVN